MQNQTGIDFLLEKWECLQSLIPPKIIEEAKEIDRQNVISAYVSSCTFDSCMENKKGCTCGVDYFNKTFELKSNESEATKEN